MGTGITSLRVVPDGSSSDAWRRVRDEEVRDLADEAFRGALSILDQHRAQLDALTTRLLTNEVLERKDIDEIMVGVPSVAPPRIGGGELGIAAATAENPAPPTPRR